VGVEYFRTAQLSSCVLEENHNKFTLKFCAFNFWRELSICNADYCVTQNEFTLGGLLTFVYILHKY